MAERPLQWLQEQFEAVGPEEDRRNWGDDSVFGKSLRAVVAMLEANKPRGNRSAKRLDQVDAGNAPRWPSNLSFIDNMTGGFYGFSVCAGFPNLGKSTIALASAIEAAASLEWNVLFLNAELADEELGRRLDQYLAVHPSAEDAVDHMRIVSVPRGFRIEDIQIEAQSICGDDRPILTVIDSINTCAQLMGGNYLDSLRELCLFCMMSRRISRAAASFLVVSELNRGGQAKGMNLEYWADMVIRLTGGKQKGWIDIRLAKTRATQGEDAKHKHVRVHHSSRFLREHEFAAMGSERLAVVGQNDEDPDVF